MERIINSVEDSDAYFDTMGVVSRRLEDQWGPITTREQYINRDPTFHFSDGFERALRQQIDMMADVRMTPEEFNWKVANQPWLPRSFLEWKRDTFRFRPEYVKVKVTDGKLDLRIEGPQSEALFWETPLLTTISRLRFTILLNEERMKPDAEWRDRLRRKYDQMIASKVSWVDYGTRRRFSYEIEDEVCRLGRDYQPYFRGTSDPHFAMKHGLKTFGTYAHKMIQLMMARYGARRCNERAMFHWYDCFRGDLGIALTDTVTTPVFLRDFTSFYANLFTGVRQDSGNPHDVAEMVIAHYLKLGIDPMTKVIVFSDGLDAGAACTLSTKFSSRIKVTCGIGTNLTHSVGDHLPPMNHVIKAVNFKFGDGRWIDVCKISDSSGKIVGDPKCVEMTKWDCGIS